VGDLRADLNAGAASQTDKARKSHRSLIVAALVGAMLCAGAFAAHRASTGPVHRCSFVLHRGVILGVGQYSSPQQALLHASQQQPQLRTVTLVPRPPRPLSWIRLPAPPRAALGFFRGVGVAADGHIEPGQVVAGDIVDVLHNGYLGYEYVPPGHWFFCSPRNPPGEAYAAIQTAHSIKYNAGPFAWDGTTYQYDPVAVDRLLAYCAPFIDPYDTRESGRDIEVSYSVPAGATTSELASAEACVQFHGGSFF
jgi:hypothetical protein